MSGEQISQSNQSGERDPLIREAWRNRKYQLIAGLSLSACIGLFLRNQAINDENLSLRFKLTQQTAATASVNAELFSRTIYRDPTIQPTVALPVLNGEVRKIVATPEGERVIRYIDPILLAQPDPTSKPDAAGHFLAGSWIGYQSLGSNGHVKIVRSKYDVVSETFTAYSPTEIVLPNMSALVSRVPDDHGELLDTVYGYDTASKQIYTDFNGKTVLPGQVQ